ncbi:MAG: hypothetical protein ACI90V_012165 [Bacillariaceae sp.]|jgi:hypothetical protein
MVEYSIKNVNVMYSFCNRTMCFLLLYLIFRIRSLDHEAQKAKLMLQEGM